MVLPWPLFVLAMALLQKSDLADQFFSVRTAAPMPPEHVAASVSVLKESTTIVDTIDEKESFIFMFEYWLTSVMC